MERKELISTALALDVQFNKHQSWTVDQLLEKLCLIKPVIVPVLKKVKDFTPDDIDQLIDQFLALYEELCDGKLDGDDLKEFLRLLCLIVKVLKPVLYQLHLLNSPVGVIIKIFLQITDALCLMLQTQ